MSKRISLCALFFGDNPKLAHRCLNSIWERLPEGKAHLHDIRIGINAVSPSVREIINWFTEHARHYHNVPVIHYDCAENACKYPLMRRMLLSDPRPVAEFTMWFDDDSYLDGGDGWWDMLLRSASGADMLGKRYTQGIRNKQWEWVIKQPWYTAKVGKPTKKKGRHAFLFATGGWWVVRTAIFKQWDWPIPELKHCGGDSMLGELLRHQKLRLVNFDKGVRINADDKGRHSKARPRGESWNRKLLGANGWVKDKDLSHQEFEMVRRTYGCE